MSKAPFCIADRPELTTFFASLPPDAERDRLVSDYQRLSAIYVETNARASELRLRIGRIVDELVEASGKGREALMVEYTVLAGELDLLPDLRAQVARRYAEALGAWASYVRPQAAQERERATAEINGLIMALSPHQLMVIRLEQSTELKDANRTAFESARAEIARLQGEMKPHITRRDETERVLSFVDIAVSRTFGDDARRRSVRTEDIDRFVGRIAKTAA